MYLDTSHPSLSPPAPPGLPITSPCKLRMFRLSLFIYLFIYFNPLSLVGCRATHWDLGTYYWPHSWRKVASCPQAAIICQHFSWGLGEGGLRRPSSASKTNFCLKKRLQWNLIICMVIKMFKCKQYTSCSENPVSLLWDISALFLLSHPVQLFL